MPGVENGESTTLQPDIVLWTTARKSALHRAMGGGAEAKGREQKVDGA